MNEQQQSKLDTSSKDIMGENLEKLRELFPSVVKEGSVDVEALKNIIGDISEPNQEYYNFTWAGKSDAFKIIKERSNATLKPQKSDDESVDFDETENIFIEGDNLEVLKILQKTYHNAIKMIYIDPPYNKDKDFVYPDKWSEGLKSYLEYAKLVDEDGNITSSSAEDKAVKQGRKHSRWLTMMYPRLFIARNLLKDDGVIFISIDDDEVKNLRMICDEIFGEENFVGQLVLKTATDNNKTQINIEHEYMIVYAKNKEIQDYWERKSSNAEKIQEKYLDLKLKHKNNIEQIQVELRKWIKSNEKDLERVTHYDNVDEKGVFHDGDIANTKFGGYEYEVLHPTTGKACKIPAKGFRFPESTMKKMISENDILFGKDENTLLKPKKRIENAKDALRSLIYEDGRTSTKIFESLLGRSVFDNPKSHFILHRLIDFCTHKDDIILDFFAGSGTTAHAVMALNAEDGGNRKSISVQLPEHLDKKNKKEAIEFLENIKKPTNIAEITKERIRRAGAKIKEDYPDTTIDTGFKVFSLSESNFKKWDENITTKKQLRESLDLYKNNVKESAKPLDMLYEVILAKGLSLNSSIHEVVVGDKAMFKVNSDGVELLACFEDEITKKALDKVVELRPIYFICLDSSFKDDTALKTNSVLNFKDADILFETV